MKDVRPVHDDLEPGRADLVDEPPRLPRRVDGVGDLGLDAEGDAVLLGAPHRFAHDLDEIAPGFARVVVGMAPPHVLAVPAAGAERHDRRAERRRRGDHPAEAGETGGALGADRGGSC